jgi:hypothetical protein
MGPPAATATAPGTLGEAQGEKRQREQRARAAQDERDACGVSARREEVGV